MRRIFITLLLSMTTNVFAAEYRIDQFELRDGFDFSFILSHSKDKQYFINIDCQSFFQKMDFYQRQKGKDMLVKEYFITINECENIMQATDQCLKETGLACFNTDEEYFGCECLD